MVIRLLMMLFVTYAVNSGLGIREITPCLPIPSLLLDSDLGLPTITSVILFMSLTILFSLLLFPSLILFILFITLSIFLHFHKTTFSSLTPTTTTTTNTNTTTNTTTTTTTTTLTLTLTLFNPREPRFP